MKLIIAHRGASSYAPENTFAAFDRAFESGARHVELDVHSSRDGHIVVHHDDTLDRTTNGSGPVAEHTLADLKKLDAGSWFNPEFSNEKIPTLEEVLLQYKEKFYFHIEIKGYSPTLISQVLKLIEKHALENRVTITSFKKAYLEETLQLSPTTHTGWLVKEVNEAVIKEARRIGIRQICPKATLMTPELVSHIHNEGFEVRAWGVSNEALMHQVIQSGAEGMTINFPDILLAHLKMKKCE